MFVCKYCNLNVFNTATYVDTYSVGFCSANSTGKRNCGFFPSMYPRIVDKYCWRIWKRKKNVSFTYVKKRLNFSFSSWLMWISIYKLKLAAEGGENPFENWRVWAAISIFIRSQSEDEHEKVVQFRTQGC